MKCGTHLRETGSCFDIVFRLNVARFAARKLLVYFAYTTLLQSTNGELTFQLFYSFQTGTGAIGYPNAGLMQGGDGNLFGTTVNDYYWSKIFRISLGGILTNLVTFTPVPYSVSYVATRLLQGADGNLYGTAGLPNPYPGTPSPPQGILFRMTPEGELRVLAGFWGTNGTGSQPLGTLIQLSDKTLCGTTYTGGTPGSGGLYGFGTVFQFRTEGIYSGLLSFSFGQTNGYGPRGGLIQANDGNLYGTTSDTGLYDYAPGPSKGTIFRVASQSLETLFTFYGTNGASPTGSLLQAQDGALYGTTSSGGLGYGTVFRITTNGVFTNLFSFGGTNGAVPTGDLIQFTDGDLYGTTTGGTNNSGTVFRITTNGVLTTLVKLNDSMGIIPRGGLCLARDGNMYGTTSVRGPRGAGTIFRLVSAPVITSATQSNGAVTLNWTSFTDAVYRVEYRTNSHSGNWLTLATNVKSTGSSTFFSDSAVGDAQRFYRVVLLPH